MLYVSPELRGKTAKSLTERQHFVNLMLALFPKSANQWHAYLDDVVDAWLAERRVIHWGPTSIGKSHMWGAVLLADWLVAPKVSSTILASTSLEALEERIFGCIKKLYAAANDANDDTLPGKVFKQPKGLFYEAGGNRTGIYCVGVKPGDTESEIQKHIGKHPPRFRVALDEPQGMPYAIIRAQVNAGSSGDYKFLAMGNPKTWTDTLGRISEPKGSRKEICETMPKYWRSSWYGALVIYHDGLTNPSVLHRDGPEAGEKEFPFMLSMRRIQEVGDTEGTDSPDYWTMMRGFIPPSGLTKVVCSESEFISHGATEDLVYWKDQPEVFAAMDPAFGGSDRFILSFWEKGENTDNELIIRFKSSTDVKIELSKGNVEQQSVEKVVELLNAEGITTLEKVAIDSTAAQSEFANWLERMMEGNVWRVDYASRVSDLAIPGAPAARKEDGSQRVCRDEYKDRPTELWMAFAAFVKTGHLRNIPMEVVNQMGCRDVIENQKPMQIEPKDSKYKSKLGGRSPDEADAASMVVDLLRRRFGVVPTGTERSLKVPGMSQSWDDAVSAMHIGGSGRISLTSEQILQRALSQPRGMSNAPVMGDW